MEAPVPAHNSTITPSQFHVELDDVPVKPSALSSHFILTVKSVGYKRVHGDEYFIKFKNICCHFRRVFRPKYLYNNEFHRVRMIEFEVTGHA